MQVEGPSTLLEATGTHNLLNKANNFARSLPQWSLPSGAMIKSHPSSA